MHYFGLTPGGRTIPPIAFIVLGAIGTAGLWVLGETSNQPWLRRIAGPVCAILLIGLAVVATTVSVSFDGSIRYSGATKAFVGAIVKAIDRGDVDAAHAELRRFDKVSIETYEGGSLLEWLREPVDRLADDSKPE